MLVVNGKSYASLDEMPPEVRQEYEQAMGLLADKDQNGVPDVFEGMMQAGNVNVQTTTITGPAQFIVDGKTYASVDDLPPEARQKYEQALPKLRQVMGDANQNGVPDVFDRMFPAQPAPPPTPAESTTDATSSSPLLDTAPTNLDDTTANYRRMLIFAGIVIVILLVALLILGALVVLPMIK